MWKEFRDFIARGNVMDLAIGVIIGAAFGKIVTTLVEGVLMPPLGLLLGGGGFLESVPGARLLGRRPRVACRRQGQRNSGRCIWAVHQRHHRVSHRRSCGVPDRQAGESNQERCRQARRRRVGDQRVRILRIYDFDQGKALPELHVRTGAWGSASLDENGDRHCAFGNDVLGGR